ncbi:choice-of-anchor D domain-containing protein [Anaeromyxobacter oryzae]|uniref:Fibronectin type-III domain-containing protein n=1 Tax=Anaeromyxobacter oryzae TaxID=2918170 RepID=A0ABM7WVB0_9BACT|nr:choice-of-anchor D domain-containing protein [Anaeromyxobacter oryzae]BDG03445.1 hypothetical protein AMOR_24410 [Anaeromyxobacter oryzae]
MRSITAADRKAAAQRAAAARAAAAAAAKSAKTAPSLKAISPTSRLAAQPTTTASALGPAPVGAGIDYLSGLTPNYANSPLPQLDASGAVVPGTGLRKFVDTLPGLGLPGCDPATSCNANDLGQYIPVAAPKPAPPGVPADGDYYEIGLTDYAQQLHSDLPPTRLRGYQDLNGGTGNHYLGPVIIAKKGRPVRIKFSNLLGTGDAGKLFIPVDKSLMGAGMGPLDANGNACDPMTQSCASYTENRAVLHLHGGDNPWYSDGTPHQWFTPAGEQTVFKKGVSFHDVPDMPDPGDGSATYYYPNGQSARLMFYHDHSYGITRLNVYAGEAAGYLLVDDVEESLIDRGVLPNLGGVYRYGIPLIIQDKTFVAGAPADPVAGTSATGTYATDPTWPYVVPTSKAGDLWFPHVYMPNQNPYDLSGANAMGRWDYGPWFWPPVTQLTNGPLPLVGDGLNGCPVGEVCQVPGTPNPTTTPEAFQDTPIVNGTAYPVLDVEPKAYRFRILNAANDRFWNLQLYYVDPAHPTEVKMVDAFPRPSCSATVATNCVCSATASPAGCFPSTWPTDARQGGVPDPATAGPSMIQIGTEGGFLPKPAVVPPQPVNYVYNRRDIVVLNVAEKSLFLGPAERADVIVDFSSVPPGSELILYNDAPAPVPAIDPRYDYYTGDPDQTDTGGAPATLEGYGPNTRTIMKFRVKGTPGAPFDLAALNAAFATTAGQAGAFVQAQAPIVVPQSAYNSTYSATLKDNFARIQSTSMTFTPLSGGAPITIPLQPKAIHELFELDYGRMNALLGVELPFTDFFTQTTIPYYYPDPATDIIRAGETQLWKITHNGVDTHAIHFHLFNVQVVNRVGWDGAIRPPDPNELGWKDTVRMNPLEDCIVAIKPIRPFAPFPLEDSIRPLNPAVPLGSTAGFTGIDPTNNNPITVVNEVKNFGHEYVWHCHLLGHEENDMMRPVIYQVPPEDPTDLAVTWTGSGNVLTWNDNSASETSFTVSRGLDASFASATTFNAPPKPGYGSTVTFTDSSASPTTGYWYRVNASGPNGTSNWSNAVQIGPPPVATVSPTSIAFGNQQVATASVTKTVTLSNTGYGTLAVTSVSVGGATPGDFALTNGCGAAVAPGTSCTLGVTFKPATSGARAGILSINSNDPVNPVLTVSLSGTGLSVTLTADKPSPQVVGTPVTFTAQGQGASGYQYQFFIRASTATTWTMVQDWSTTSTWTMPATTPIGSYTVVVHIRTTTSGNFEAQTSVGCNLTSAAATGVTLTADKPSPQVTGTQVTFTAAGQGSSGYQYRFWFYNGVTWAIAQDYGVASTWTLPGSTPAGTYWVQVDVRTSTTVIRDALATMKYVIANVPATAVTLTASQPSPHIAGTPVVFTGIGSGSTGYQYRFWLYNGTSWSMVQDYGIGSSWTMTASTSPGSYAIQVDVRTTTTVVRDAATSMSYAIVPPPATTVTLSADSPSPHATGTSVVFTATGSGSSGYQYRFWFYDGTTWKIAQDYGTGSTWTLPGSTPPGTYAVQVDVRTSTTVVRDALATMNYVIAP